jgi:ribulose-phosphate 3-epimerase
MALDEVAGESLDLALCMSVNPGWGGQSFIKHSLDKLVRMRAALPDHVALEVDGGIHRNTIRPVAEAGANLIVAGSGVFTASDPAGAYRDLASAAWG